MKEEDVALSPFGSLLKRWRMARGISQLGLAELSNTSQRHISIIESGRARPGKQLILELAQALRLSPRDVNAIMRAAGFLPVYLEDILSQSEIMAPYLELVRNIVHLNTENPCFVIDRYWHIQDVNSPMRCLFKAMGITYEIPDQYDVIDRILDNDNMASILLNFREIAQQFLLHLRAESSIGAGDSSIDQLVLRAERKVIQVIEKAERGLRPVRGGKTSEPAEPPSPMVMLPRFRLGNEVFAAYSSVSKFGSAPHVELAELRIVWLCPADDSSRALMARTVQQYDRSYGIAS